MMAYFGGFDENKAIIAPTDKGDFNIKQETIDELSGGKIRWESLTKEL